MVLLKYESKNAGDQEKVKAHFKQIELMQTDFKQPLVTNSDQPTIDSTIQRPTTLSARKVTSELNH